MTAEDGAEKPVLHPAHIQFLVLRIAWCGACTGGIVGATEETADVGVEVRTTRHGVVQTGRHLFAKHVPG